MSWDAVVVGAGPNGLSAAITLAREGLATLLLEANDAPGGAARTESVTRPGFQHDVGSAVYPMGVSSPFFRSLPLERLGLEWIQPEIPVAHPLEGGTAAVVTRDLDETARGLGRAGPAYRKLLAPFTEAWPELLEAVLDHPFRIPEAPLLMARFATRALRATDALAARLPTVEARALLAGNAAHSGARLDAFPATAVGMVLMTSAHAAGWPVPRGGAGAITRALAAHFERLGGTLRTGERVTSLKALPPARAVLLAVTPAQIARMGEESIPDDFRARLRRWRYGPGAFKVDWALSEPIPWASEACRRAGTIHLGGTFEEIAASERAAVEGRSPDRPFLLVAQPSIHDDTRAPVGQHTAWAYCHVPNGWDGDATVAMERQMERFAPGFREVILERHAHPPAALEAWDANLVGGDVNGGAITARQWFGPGRWTTRPWSTPVPDLYMASASTPPGGGVHGMCGYHAARTALRDTFGIRIPRMPSAGPVSGSPP